jgi:hypothetical protein
MKIFRRNDLVKIEENINGFNPSILLHSNHYVRTGSTMCCYPMMNILSNFLMMLQNYFHHFHAQYLVLLDKPTDVNRTDKVASVIYTHHLTAIKGKKANINNS